MDRGIIPEDIIADLRVGDGVAHGWGGLGDGIATEIDGHKAPIEKGGRGDRQRNFRGRCGGAWAEVAGWVRSCVSCPHFGPKFFGGKR